MCGCEHRDCQKAFSRENASISRVRSLHSSSLCGGRRPYSIHFRNADHSLAELCLYARSKQEARCLGMELHAPLRSHPSRIELIWCHDQAVEANN